MQEGQHQKMDKKKAECNILKTKTLQYFETAIEEKNAYFKKH